MNAAICIYMFSQLKKDRCHCRQLRTLHFLRIMQRTFPPWAMAAANDTLKTLILELQLAVQYEVLWRYDFHAKYTTDRSLAYKLTHFIPILSWSNQCNCMRDTGSKSQPMAAIRGRVTETRKKDGYTAPVLERSI